MNIHERFKVLDFLSYSMEISKLTYLQGYIRSDQPLPRVEVLNANGVKVKTLLGSDCSEYEIEKESEIFWLVAHAGQYRIQIVTDNNIAMSNVELSLHSMGLKADQYLSPPSPLISPLLTSISDKIERNKRLSNTTVENAFWKEIESRGAPLIEPIDDDNVLLTFLFNAQTMGGDVHNVRVLGAPYDGHIHLTQLADSSIWYKSIEIPKSSRFSYRIAPNVPQLIDQHSMEQRRAVLATTQPDPLNLQPLFAQNDQLFGPASTVILSDAPSDHYTISKSSPIGLQVKKGKVEEFIHYSVTLHAEDELAASRKICIYRPHPIYPLPKNAPLLIMFDGDAYLTKVPTPTILDNLIAEGKIPPTRAVFVNTPLPSLRGKELTPNQPFSDYMTTELMPWLADEHGIIPSAKNTIVSGSSFGGLASMYLAFTHPHIFGNVLSLSGSFWWSPEDQPPFKPNDQQNWFSEQIRKHPKQEINVYLNAGVFEVKPESHNILRTNQQLHLALKNKDYQVDYEEFASGHDYFSWRVTLANGLIKLFG